MANNIKDAIQEHLKNNTHLYTEHQMEILNYLICRPDESDDLRALLDQHTNYRGKYYRGAFASEKNHVIAYLASRPLCGTAEHAFWDSMHHHGIISSNVSGSSKSSSFGFVLPRNIGGYLWLAEAFGISWTNIKESLHMEAVTKECKNSLIVELKEKLYNEFSKGLSK